jgi:UDP-N-acetylglucosamine 1-carboxyvinyltransferase
MFLDEVSVTATENIMMAAVLAKGTTVIEPAATEPHIVNLGTMLVSMGGRIEGLGTHMLKIHGVEKLRGTATEVGSDEIETGTLAIAIGITHGTGTIHGVDPKNLGSIRHKLNQFGIETELEGTKLHVSSKAHFKGARIQIDTWPRLPTDLQPQLTVLATQSEGTSLVHDWMYDRRLLYTDDLVTMGANILLCDPHRALVAGPTPLKGKTIISPDIRAGMAFVLAGLIASGKTTIEQAHLIERGYEKIDDRLRQLGTVIERTET